MGGAGSPGGADRRGSAGEAGRAWHGQVPLPEPIDIPVLRQRWKHTGFVHWGYPPEDVRRLVPPELEVDVFDGRAWVSLVMFRAERTRLPGMPPVPMLSNFVEINLRTYVTATGDRPGLWFFSLEAPQPALVIGARVLAGVPYKMAKTSVRAREDEVVYRSRRTGEDDDAALECRLRIGEDYRDDELGELDHFLTARWGAYTLVGEELRYNPVEHRLWPLHHAELVFLDETLTAAAGLPLPPGDPLVQYASQVDATLGVHRSVGG